MISEFNDPASGLEAQKVVIANDQVSASVLTYGARLQDFRALEQKVSLVVGFETLGQYLAQAGYFGATVGRVANRIADGRFTLDGVEYQLNRNLENGHHLHGGQDGLHCQIWDIADHGPDFVTLTTSLADGHMGYPGRLEVTARYAVSGTGLDITYRAKTDRLTICNIAHHSYWNLGNGTSTLDHELEVQADAYTPTDRDGIPTGRVDPLDGSDLDFRKSRALRAMERPWSLDHNFCLSTSRQSLRPVARITCPSSDVELEVHTTESGLQIYGAGLMEVGGLALDGTPIGPHCGIALEPQVWPDAINNTGFPDSLLRPGQVYEQQTRFEILKR